MKSTPQPFGRRPMTARQLWDSDTPIHDALVRERRAKAPRPQLPGWAVLALVAVALFCVLAVAGVFA